MFSLPLYCLYAVPACRGIAVDSVGLTANRNTVHLTTILQRTERRHPLGHANHHHSYARATGRQTRSGAQATTQIGRRHHLPRPLPLLHRAPAHPDRPLGSPCSLLSAAEVPPYLSIQSAVEQSGKTLSLQLLSLLCPNPALTANFATSTLSSRIHYSEQRPTFLLDECHATLGSRNRSKNPVLRAVLTSGFHRGLGHTDRQGERVIFSPKAFAGIGPLPHALAERSIPIHLERLNASVQLHEFRSEQAEAQAQPLRQWLAQWGKEDLQKLKSAPTLGLKEYPAGGPLTPRRQDLLQPLLQIAKDLGQEWALPVATG